MSRPKSARSYPRAFLDAVERLNTDPASPVRLKCVDAKEARDFQLEWSSYKIASINEGLTKQFPELSGLRTRIYQDGDQCVLEIYNIDYSPVARAMEKALKQEEDRS